MSDVDPIRVLHVDDDPEIVDLASTFLEREDDRLVIELAETGEEALDRIAAGDIHCVISDYQLPDTECASFLSAIRDAEPGMPFILFTGRDRAQLDDALLENEVTAYLQKGSGTEQYGELADEILTAVTGNDDVRTDGGRPRDHPADRDQHGDSQGDDGGEAGSGRELRPDGSGGTLDELRDITALDGGDPLSVLEDALDALDDAFFVLDPDGTLVYWNDRISEVTGYTDAEIAEMEATEFFAPADVETVVEALAETRETGTAQIRVEAQPKDGEPFPVAFRGTRLTDESGSVIGLAGTARDITEQVAYERELERQNERLEELVGAVSHDFRNPLNVISGRLELARELGDEEHFEALGRGVERLETLLNDLVELGRKGHTVDETTEVDLAELAESVWTEIETGEASLTVAFEGTLAADRSRLRKLLEHLFQNAVEHAGGDASVRLDSLDDGLFYVADDGPGIPDDAREQLLEYGESRSDEGTGLGLAVARRIVEAHGWTIRITDSESGGTRIEIRERLGGGLPGTA